MNTAMMDSLGPVSLQPITRETVWSIVDLKVAPDQEKFIAPNSDSLLEAQFAPEAWFRAIYAGDVPVGFVMVAENSNAHGPLSTPTGEYFLWRLMIAADYQGRGYGRRALDLLVAALQARPDVTMLVTSCGQGEGSPREFYHKAGFKETGEIVDDEIVLQLPLR
jgi:diamine N-acetyltransferase